MVEDWNHDVMLIGPGTRMEPSAQLNTRGGVHSGRGSGRGSRGSQHVSRSTSRQPSIDLTTSAAASSGSSKSRSRASSRARSIEPQTTLTTAAPKPSSRTTSRSCSPAVYPAVEAEDDVEVFEEGDELEEFEFREDVGSIRVKVCFFIHLVHHFVATDTVVYRRKLSMKGWSQSATRIARRCPVKRSLVQTKIPLAISRYRVGQRRTSRQSLRAPSSSSLGQRNITGTSATQSSHDSLIPQS